MTSTSFLSAGLRLLPALFMFMMVSGAPAQEETKEEAQYREDYEQFQKIKAISDPMKRADGFYEFLKQRPNTKLLKNTQAEYLMILEAYSKAPKHPDLEALALRLIQLFPKVGETYYYYGAALQEAKRLPEAMNALAKCYVLKNSGSDLARTRLEFLYKSQNRGSLAGMDALIQKARAEVLK